MTNLDISNLKGCYGIRDEVQCKSTELSQKYCEWDCNVSEDAHICNNPC